MGAEAVQRPSGSVLQRAWRSPTGLPLVPIANRILLHLKTFPARRRKLYAGVKSIRWQSIYPMQTLAVISRLAVSDHPYPLRRSQTKDRCDQFVSNVGERLVIRCSRYRINVYLLKDERPSAPIVRSESAQARLS